MSKLLTIAFLSILSVSMSLGIKRAKIGGSCHPFHWCDHGLACINYRCAIATEDNLNEEVPYAPKGPKCAPELAKYCPSHYFCKEHRCYR